MILSAWAVTGGQDTSSLLGKLGKRSGIIPVIRGPDFLRRGANNDARLLKFYLEVCCSESVRISPPDNGIPGTDDSISIM